MTSKICWYATPTFWITTVLSLALFAVTFKPFAYVLNETVRIKEVSSRVWPVERAATLALVKSRQSIAPLAGEKTISLKPFLNATLGDSVDEFKGNNLAELSAGIHTFGGVSFDVPGRIQLAGGEGTSPNRRFPTRVEIPVSFKCSRLHLLQGADNVGNPGDKVAWLVLHYQNGTQARMDIIDGQNILDFWGPTYNTSSYDRYTTSLDTELAWIGSNPEIKKQSPEFSLRLYRTTFINPHPELEITSIDYVSALSGASPFLTGLSIEKP